MSFLNYHFLLKLLISRNDAQNLNNTCHFGE
jgi:hypothetical protein